jgi:hypothetical protein
VARTGIIHAHSKFSYDGEHALDELVALARRRGFEFIAMTEHTDTLNGNQMSRFVQECRRLSDSQFLVIPGIEFVCSNDLHILGLGIALLTDSQDPTFVARFIHEQGGLAIIAHPSRNGYKIPAGLAAFIDGVEVWNARYDGWFVPNDLAISLRKNLQKDRSVIIAVGGQDLHEMKSRGFVKTIVACDKLSQTTILKALKEGSFWISNSYLKLDPAALDEHLRLAFIACARRIYLLARSVGRPIRNGFRAMRGDRPKA